MYEKEYRTDVGDRELRAIGRLFSIIRRLRGPDGCPWDRKQTLSSMRRYVLEEAFELIEGVDEDDDDSIREELGDVFLINGMLGVIAEEDGRFSVEEVFDEVSDKLVRRHPHVFGSSEADSAGAVEAQWERIKSEEKAARRRSTDRPDKDRVPDNDRSNGDEEREGGLGNGGLGNGNEGAVGSEADAPWEAGVSRSMPALERARRVQKAASKEGFDWPEELGAPPILDKIREETNELEELLSPALPPTPSPTHPKDQSTTVEDELGDLLFSVVNLARRLKLDPSLALSRSVDKFERRFAGVHRELQRRRVTDPSPALFEELWELVKKRS